ncbi:MAG: YbaK/EbsC family protein [Gammaproteobacteria bacterium]|nr:YbaK/EbsC family protein [Gammaproteobacteria bacterium]
MTIAQTVQKHLKDRKIDYDVITHSPTGSSSETAQSAHVPGDRIAKGVVVKDSSDYLLAVVPGEHYLDVKSLGEHLNRDLEMADESELGKLFIDCKEGAVPALGIAYGLTTLVDEGLLKQPELYFEAGDHESLIQVKEADFEVLMEGAEFGVFSHHRL